MDKESNNILCYHGYNNIASRTTDIYVYIYAFRYDDQNSNMLQIVGEAANFPLK